MNTVTLCLVRVLLFDNFKSYDKCLGCGGSFFVDLIFGQLIFFLLSHDLFDTLDIVHTTKVFRMLCFIAGNWFAAECTCGVGDG